MLQATGTDYTQLAHKQFKYVSQEIKKRLMALLTAILVSSLSEYSAPPATGASEECFQTPAVLNKLCLRPWSVVGQLNLVF